MAIKLTNFSEQRLIQFLQSHQETSLNLKVNLQSNEDISYLKIIEDQFSSLIHLTEFSIKIPHYCVLAQRGYTHISNAIQNLTQLTKLQIKIYGFIEDEEIILLKNSIQNLANLETLIFKVYPFNDISSLIGQKLVDSLSSLSNLRKLILVFQKIKISQKDDGNIHFWRGIQSLQNLQKLSLEIQEWSYGQQDLIELFSHIIDLTKLKSISFNSIGDHQQVEFIDMIISYLGQMVNLQSLKIEFDGGSEVYFSETQRKEILKSLSNLKYLEKFKSNTIQRQLMKHHMKEYADLIGNLKYLKKLDVLCNLYRIEEIKLLNYLGQSFLNLTNITHFELSFLPFKVYNEFISDLSISLENMKNLRTLKLSLGELNYFQCTQLSVSLNKLYTLTSLLIDFSHYKCIEESSLLMQKLDGGFINLKELTFKVGIYSECNFNTFLQKLNNLESLEISNIKFRYDQDEDFGQFYKTFRNLKQLKKMDVGFTFNNLVNQADIQIIESTFKELQFLEDLKIIFRIQNKSEDITKMNILEYLKNLKKLSIQFSNIVVNVFYLSPSSQINSYNLEEIEFLYDHIQFLKSEIFLEVIDSLSSNFPMVKKLTLKLYLRDSTTHIKKFGTICSKLINLTDLNLFDRGSQKAMSFYPKGIKQLKSLNKLKMGFQCQQKEVRHLGTALQKLQNLQKIQFLTKLNKTDLANFEKEISKVLQNHEKLRSILISPNEDETSYQSLMYAVSLNQFNQKEVLRLEAQNEKIIDANETGEEQNSSKKTVSKLLKQQPYQLKTDIIKIGEEGSEHLSLINNFNNIEIQYLFDLEMTVNILDYNEQCQYELSVKDFTIQFNQLNRLRYLTLDLFKLSFTEEQIIYFSQNIRHLINLRELSISIDRIDDHYSSFFEELIHLKELRALGLEIKISDRALTSLGNSLTKLTNLKDCTLKFDSSSQFGIQGLLSLLNGLKCLTNMKKLIFHLNSEGLKNENSLESDALVVDFFEKMKKLYFFEFKLDMNQNEIKVLELISSLRQLQSLEILIINLSSNHPLNQEMLDKLVNSINLLTRLRAINISIHFESNNNNNNNEMKIPKELNNYFNRSFHEQLEIRDKDQSIELFQTKIIFLRIYSRCITNKKLEFMEDLNEKKIIEFHCSQSCIQTILNQMESCRVNKIRLKDIHIKEEQDANDFCTLLSKIPHTSMLQITMRIEQSILDDLLSQIVNSINQLKNLHTLSLILTTNDYGYQYQALSEKHLLQVVSIIQNHKKLQELYMNKNPFSGNEQVQKSIKKKLKKLKKLVKYNDNFDHKYLF